jgi:hypothetical protein
MTLEKTEGPALKKRVEDAAQAALQYVHTCQLEDGGYFFARILPGSLLDSYFAVETIRMLGQRPQQPEALERFVYSLINKGLVADVHGLYLSAAILKDLKKEMEPLHSHGTAIARCLGVLSEVGGPDSLYTEVVSELEKVFEAVSVLVHLEIPFDRKSIVSFISSLANENGGFGWGRVSSLATTYYAVQTLAMLGHPLQQHERTLSFLRQREQNVQFLEDMYYLSSASYALGESLSDRERAISFVLDCGRSSGGFARARPIGIATLEYTYYAMSVFKQLEVL